MIDSVYSECYYYISVMSFFKIIYACLRTQYLTLDAEVHFSIYVSAVLPNTVYVLHVGHVAGISSVQGIIGWRESGTYFF